MRRRHRRRLLRRRRQTFDRTGRSTGIKRCRSIGWSRILRWHLRIIHLRIIHHGLRPELLRWHLAELMRWTERLPRTERLRLTERLPRNKRLRLTASRLVACRAKEVVLRLAHQSARLTVSAGERAFGFLHGPVVRSRNAFHRGQLNSGHRGSRPVSGKPALRFLLPGIAAEVSVPVNRWRNGRQLTFGSVSHIDKRLPEPLLVVSRHQLQKTPLLLHENPVRTSLRGGCRVPLVKPGAVFVEGVIRLRFAGAFFAFHFTATRFNATIVDQTFGGVVARRWESEERGRTAADTTGARSDTAAGRQSHRDGKPLQPERTPHAYSGRWFGVPAPIGTGSVQNFPPGVAHEFGRSSLKGTPGTASLADPDRSTRKRHRTLGAAVGELSDSTQAEVAVFPSRPVMTAQASSTGRCDPDSLPSLTSPRVHGT